jgi:hypothetical protein
VESRQCKQIGGRITFELTKWYADCVTPGGEVIIAYCAELRWHGFSLSYAATLVRRSGLDTRAETTFTRARMPELRDSTLLWDCPALHAHGEWTAQQPAVHEEVYRGVEGSIEWVCLQPESAVRIRAGDLLLEGPGYAERLHMTIPPWNMPIDELRWGRYVTPGDAVTWIQWRGAHEVEIVYENGTRVPARRIEDDHIELESGTSLSFDRAHVLRQGSLGSAALAGLPGLNKIVPARILQVVECKWLSRTTLLRNGSAARAGWAIHEVVRWP